MKFKLILLSKKDRMRKNFINISRIKKKNYQTGPKGPAETWSGPNLLFEPHCPGPARPELKILGGRNIPKIT